MCINRSGSLILVATARGVQEIHPAEDRHPESDQLDTVEGAVVGAVDVGDRVEIVELRGDDVFDAESNMRTVDLFSFLDQSGQSQDKFKIPTCIAAHPKEDLAILGNSRGSVWLRTFADDRVIAKWHTPNRLPCVGISFSSDGSVFGAVHNNQVRLWSLCQSEFQEGAFSAIDTFADDTYGLGFLWGTGLIVTNQSNGHRARGMVAFWDMLMPQARAMVAQVKLDAKYGRSDCMVYAPRNHQLLVGTSMGSVCVVDPRQFKVVATLKSATESRHPTIRSIAVDDKHGYAATGHDDGSLKVWDLASSHLLSELKGVHRRKAYQVGGKVSSLGITSILIYNDFLYTSGADGLVKAVSLS
jgi:WD40 repeat protein